MLFFVARKINKKIATHLLTGRDRKIYKIFKFTEELRLPAEYITSPSPAVNTICAVIILHR
jgi:hypothetical protein